VRVLSKRVKSVPEVKFGLVFRSEPVSVPVMRRVLGDTLRGLGVDEESVYDILLATTEACTNVLIHGRHVRGYAVVTSLGAVRCQVEVAGEGAGALLAEAGLQEPAARGPAEAPVPAPPAVPAPVPGNGALRETAIAQLAESGRGLAVMRACVDTVTLDNSPERGTVVTMSKHIRWSRDAPLRQFRAAS
jgi:serine/threonine-protein kinase RsbW